MKSYKEIFDIRGNIYHKAMTKYPNARDKEFLNVINLVSNRNAKIADIPAGGKYLNKYIPNCDYMPLEYADGFENNFDDLLPFLWENNSIDTIISLAGIHHLENKLPLFKEMYRVLKKGGELILADVEKDSMVSDFLDNFVAQNNSTGHDGIYLNEDTTNELISTGFNTEKNYLSKYNWVFENKKNMADFCRLMFDLKVNDEKIIKAIEETLGIENITNGNIGMKWELRTLKLRKTL